MGVSIGVIDLRGVIQGGEISCTLYLVRVRLSITLSNGGDSGGGEGGEGDCDGVLAAVRVYPL